MEYKIVFEDEKGKHEYLISNEVTSVGRLDSNDIVLKDKLLTVSRSHCEFLLKDGELYIRDLGSKNGTFVNEEKVVERKVSPGDQIKVGSFILKVEKAEPKKVSTEDSGVTTIVESVKDFENYWQKKEAEEDIIKLIPELAKELIETSSLEDILEKSLFYVRKTINPEGVFIFLEDENGNLELKLSNIDNDDKRDISKTILERVLKEKVSILTMDAMSDERFSKSESIIFYGIKTALAVPMFYKDRIFGVIYVDRVKKTIPFDKKDLETLTVLSNYISIAINNYYLRKSVEEEKNLRKILERYHSPSVIGKILKEKESFFTFNRTKGAVFFLDIVGFTSFSEKLEPEEVGEYLNKFFTEATDIIFKYEGTLDKYIGDAILAVFGVPVPYDDYELRSVYVGLEILEKLHELNSKGELPNFRIRIGINSGELVAGNFGSPKRMEYTVIGTTVNVASRLEEEIAGPNEIVVSESVYNSTKDKIEYEFIGEKSVSGISKPIKVYKVKGKK